MSQPCEGHFEIQPILDSRLPEVAAFLHRIRNIEAEGLQASKLAHESADSIERRLNWLLLQNPVAPVHPNHGYFLCDSSGVIRGINLCFPAAFLSGEKRLLGLCSGTFFVDPCARSLGFYLFRKCLKEPGYSFHFASTCNAHSSALWKSVGASAVPNSETEYILPLRLDVAIATYAAYRTSSRAAARFARMCGRSVNPILRIVMRPSMKLAIEPCQDWEKLSALAERHRCPEHVTNERTPALLQWRYGSVSPANPCGVYSFRDKQGNEGWFALSHLDRGEGGQFRSCIVLDAVWPRNQMSFRDLLQEILRVAGPKTDAISFRCHPGLDVGELGRWVFPRKLVAPRAFVKIPKGLPQFPLASLDYDDSDYIGWAFPWRQA